MSGFDDPDYQKLKEQILGKQNGNSSTSNGVPARQQPQLSPEQALHDWRYHVGLLIKEALDAVPEKDRETVAGFKKPILIDTVVKDAKKMMAARERPVWPLPLDLSESEAEEELDKLANRAVEVFCGAYLPTTGERTVPAIYEFPAPLRASAWYKREEEIYARVTWIWHNILEGGGVSILAGKKGVGKSTFVRTLMLCAARGIPFLDRNMTKTRVWYIDMEPGGSARKNLLVDLGWTDEDELLISTSSPLAGREGLFEWMKGIITANDIGLVVVDTMYKLLRIEGTNDYNLGIYGQIPLEELARETGCHFLLLHHARKNGAAFYAASIAEEVLGSVGIAATACAVMLVRKRTAEISTFQMDPPRYGEGIEGEIVLTKENTGWIVGGSNWANQWVIKAKEAVLAGFDQPGGDFLSARDVDVPDPENTNRTLKEKTKKWIMKKLFEDHELERTGAGKKGDPFKYRKAQKEDPTDLDPNGISYSK